MSESDSGAVGDPALLGLPPGPWLNPALDFNFNPASYLHPSWIPDLPHGELIGDLLESNVDRDSVSRHLLQSMELDSEFCQDFRAPLARLALLDGEDLQHLFLCLGAALRAGEIRLALLGAQVRQLKQALGDDVYDIAAGDAQRLGPLPDFAFEPDTIDLRLRYQLIGAAWCDRHLGCTAGVRSRLQLKLPAGWWAQISAGDARHSGAGPVARTFPPFMQQLVSEVLPRWQPLFD